MNAKYLFLWLTILLGYSCNTQENKILWQIGTPDNKASEFALAPDKYQDFLENDFGWEDRFYLIGKSSPETDFPYILPG
ncbi:MAG: hypothetical protein LBR84_08570, partial [Tannerella sp.]|nr:hypothetical protein [Tannerella sp.]